MNYIENRYRRFHQIVGIRIEDNRRLNLDFRLDSTTSIRFGDPNRISLQGCRFEHEQLMVSVISPFFPSTYPLSMTSLWGLIPKFGLLTNNLFIMCRDSPVRGAEAADLISGCIIQFSVGIWVVWVYNDTQLS